MTSPGKVGLNRGSTGLRGGVIFCTKTSILRGAQMRNYLIHNQDGIIKLSLSEKMRKMVNLTRF